MTEPPRRGGGRLERLRRRRAAWLVVHRWLGLAAGLFLAVFGLTGALLVFYQELDEALFPAQLQVTPRPGGEDAWRPLAELLPAARAASGQPCPSPYVRFPRTEGSALWVYCFFEEEAGSSISIVFVDPYTGRVTGTRSDPAAEHLPRNPVDFVAYLHYTLLLKDQGYLVAGLIALLLLFSLPTGLILWWPITGNWRAALTMKRSPNAQRLNLDLHRLAGLWTLPVLAALLVSGVYMDLPGPFMSGLRLLSPGTRDGLGELAVAPLEGVTPIGPDEALAVARRAWPQGRLNYLLVPDAGRTTYQVTRSGVPGPSRFWSERTVAVDPWRAAVVGMRDAASRRTAGEAFVDWLWPLHSGKAFGWPGRILILLVGLSCPLLAVTGLLRWRRRRRGEQVLQARGGRPAGARG